MVTLWRVKFKWGFEFERVEAERVTKHRVYLRGTYTPRSTTEDRYFEDFEEAKQFARQSLEDKLETARSQAALAERDLKQLESATAESIPLSVNTRSGSFG